MNNQKFIVMGGYVKSKHDGDTHYIPAHDVADLYNIPPKFAKKDTCGVNWNWIGLHPDSSGEYNLAKEVAHQIRDHWMPLAARNAIKDIEKASLWQRIMFVFTKKLPLM